MAAKKKMSINVAAIEWLVGKLHVGTPDDEVAADIRRRAEKAGWPAEARDRAVKIAPAAHHKNRDLYYDVVRGRIR